MKDLNEKLNKKSLTELLELKNAVESIVSKYANQLTDYALMCGASSVIDGSKKEIYEKRMKYHNLALNIENEIIKRIDEEFYD